MQFHHNTSLIYHKIRTQVLTYGFLFCINMHFLKTLVDFYLTCLAAFQIYLCRVTCEKFYISDRLYWGQFWDWSTWRYGCSEPFWMNEFAEWCTWTLPFVASCLSDGLCMILMKVWIFIYWITGWKLLLTDLVILWKYPVITNWCSHLMKILSHNSLIV